MKSINSSDPNPQWGNDLLRDLAFIRKKHRYPLSKKTLPGALLITVFGLFAARMFYVAVLVGRKAPVIYQWILIPLMLVSLYILIYRYYRTLRFRLIPAPFGLQKNMELIGSFLQSRQLALYRHPEAPEVFQIMSRPLGNPEHEKREVMIFIAGDKDILVNSHFVNQKSTISPPSDNATGMARQLNEWIRQSISNEQRDVTIAS